MGTGHPTSAREARHLAAAIEAAADRLLEPAGCAAAAALLGEAARLGGRDEASGRYARAGFLAHLAGRGEMVDDLLDRAEAHACPAGALRVARLRLIAGAIPAPPAPGWTPARALAAVRRDPAGAARLAAAAAAVLVTGGRPEEACELSRIALESARLAPPVPGAVAFTRAAALAAAGRGAAARVIADRLGPAGDIDLLTEDGHAVLPLLGLLTAGLPGALDAAGRSARRAQRREAPAAYGRLLCAVCEIAFLSGDLRTAEAAGARALRLPVPAHDRRRTAGWWARAAAARGRTDAALAALAGAGPRDDPGLRAAAVFVGLSRGAPEAGPAEACGPPGTVAATPSGLLAGLDAVECLVRGGRGRPAVRALAGVAAVANADGGDLARGLLARGRGLVDDDFAPHLAESILLLGRAGNRFEAARSALVLGMRLRRARRRSDACVVLLDAQAALSGMGAASWAAQADAELEPLLGRRAPARSDALTPRERQVARAAAAGATSREIAGRLYISEKTVERHLGVVYRKLGIRRRVELAGLMARGS